MLLTADFVFINIVTYNHTELSYECPDLSNNHGHSHTNIIGDEILYSDTMSNHYISDSLHNPLLFSDSSLTDNYSSEIWQPPKIS